MNFLNNYYVLRYFVTFCVNLLRFALICYVLRYVSTFWEMLRFAASIGTAKRNTAAKRKTLLRFARPPFTFWVISRKNIYYVLR